MVLWVLRNYTQVLLNNTLMDVKPTYTNVNLKSVAYVWIPESVLLQNPLSLRQQLEVIFLSSNF